MLVYSLMCVTEKHFYVGYERGGSEKAEVLIPCSVDSDILAIQLREDGQDEFPECTHFAKECLATYHKDCYRLEKVE